MRWRRRRSEHVRDQRGATPGGAGFPIPIGKASLPVALVGILVFVLVRALGGGSAFDVPGIDQLPQAPAAGGEPIPAEADPDRDLVDFSSFVLDDVQTTWQRQFQGAGERYTPAGLVLFTQATQTSCGMGTSDVGPFYCPRDQTVYLDLEFFRELNRRFGAPGEAAPAAARPVERTVCPTRAPGGLPGRSVGVHHAGERPPRAWGPARGA